MIPARSGLSAHFSDAIQLRARATSAISSRNVAAGSFTPKFGTLPFNAVLKETGDTSGRWT